MRCSVGSMSKPAFTTRIALLPGAVNRQPPDRQDEELLDAVSLARWVDGDA
jgi:hypothetical protein